MHKMANRRGFLSIIAACGLVLSVAGAAGGQTGTVKGTKKIDQSTLAAADPSGSLVAGDNFGDNFTSLGDLDGDGIPDLAVGAWGDNGSKGAIWIVYMNADESVKGVKKINQASADPSGTPGLNDYFGSSITSLGDLDSDGIPDLAVGVTGADGFKGAVWILYMDANENVKSVKKIDDNTLKAANPSGSLIANNHFGRSITSLGDLDGDNIPDLAVGAWETNDSGLGAVWILYMNADQSVKAVKKIDDNTLKAADPSVSLAATDHFGYSVTSLGDLDVDGIPDLAVGAWGTDSGLGAVWILYMNADESVKGVKKIDQSTLAAANPSGTLAAGDHFGSSVTSSGDLDGDDIPDLAVGTFSSPGTAWILYMKADGSVKGVKKIDQSTLASADPSGSLVAGDNFGCFVTSLGDLDGDNMPDLAVGARGTDSAKGAIWILYMTPPPVTLPPLTRC